MTISVQLSAFILVISLIAFFVLCFKGFGIIPCAIVCSAIVAFTLEGGVYNTLLGAFATGFGNFAGTYLLPFILGVFFANMMSASGCSESVGRFLIRKAGPMSAPYIIMFVSILMGFGGITACPFIVAPLAFSILKQADIPREVGCVAMVGSYSMGSYLIPGSANTANMILSRNLGTSLYSAPLMGFVMLAIGVVLVALYLRRLTKKFRNAGIGYTPASSEISANKQWDDSELPSFVLGIAPIIIVAGITMILQLAVKWAAIPSVITAQALGIVFIYVTNWNRITVNKFTMFGEASIKALPGLIQTCVIVGYSSVVSGTLAYSAMIDALTQLKFAPYIAAVISIAAICAICGDSIAGVASFSSTLGQTFLNMSSVNPAALHRLCMATATTFDSMPHNGPLNIQMQVMGLTHKEVYKYVVVVQILITSLYTIVGLLMALFLY